MNVSNNPSNVIYIDGKKISQDSPVYFIAEIGSNFDGNLERAKDLIFLAKEAGADAAKFQHYTAKSLVSDQGFESLPSNKSHQSSWTKSVFETYHDASLNADWTSTLKETCKEAGISFFTSPYSKSLVDLVDDFLPAYKIGSGDITWIEIVNYIASKNKPVLLATGASDISDVTRAMESILQINQDIILMQCNTNYTGSKENFKYLNLNVIKQYQKLYPGVITGLSDHTHGDLSVLGAISLGARVIEKHFTDSISRVGPDHPFSMTPNTWRDMVNKSRDLEAALGISQKRVENNELETKILQRRSICASRDISKGTVLGLEHLNMLRPCPDDAIQPFESNLVIGKVINRDINEGEYFKFSYLD